MSWHWTAWEGPLIVPSLPSLCRQFLPTEDRVKAPSSHQAEQVSWGVGIPLPTTTNDGQEGREEKDTGLRSIFYFYHPF